MGALLFVLTIGLLLIGLNRYKYMKDDDTGAAKMCYSSRNSC